MNHAPEIDVDQPFHLRLIDFVEAAEQRDTGIVDDDVERRVGRDRGPGKILDLRGLADVDAVRRHLPLAVAADLGGNLLQPRFVAIGEPFWRRWPLPDGVDPEGYVPLSETAARLEAAGFALTGLVAASEDDWDRYEGLHWRAMEEWLAEHPDEEL